jgi:preprotein translocase subunit SecG
VRILLTILFILVCISLTVIVLAQEGKDAGLGSIGGLSESYWGKNKSRSKEGALLRITKYLAAGFLILALLLNMMPDKNRSTATSTNEPLVTANETESEMLTFGTEAEPASTEAE